MRKARYDLRRVVCPNATLLGSATRIAKPGYWVYFNQGAGAPTMGRVLGRIVETDRDGKDCAGYLAVIAWHGMHGFCGVRWVDPAEVTECHANPPRAILEWLTGAEWVKNKNDIARIVAMSQHGTLSDSYIGNRDNPEQAYNARPEYVRQFILGE